MSELRLYLRRDSFLEGNDCTWALLDDKNQIQSSGNQLVDLPRSRHCRMVLASDLVLTLKVPLPDLPERRLTPLLPAAAETATLAEADSLHVVALDRTRDGEAILAILEEAWLSRVLARLAGLGLYPDSALPEYLLLPRTEGSWTVCWRSNNPAARFGKCEGMSLDSEEPPVSLILAMGKHGRPSTIKVHHGENAGLPDLERWLSVLETPVEAVGPWDWRTAAWPELPNLLQGKHAPGLKRRDWNRMLRPIAWGTISLAAIQLFGLTVDWAMLASENASIKQEMRVLAERALPANSAIVDPPLQITERLRGMQAATGNPAPDDLIGLLGRLGQAWPKFGNIQVKTLSYEGGALRATVAEAETSWLDQLKMAAAAQGLAIISQEDKADSSKVIQLTIGSLDKEGRNDQ
jgi:general secretion pathway protein L